MQKTSKELQDKLLKKGPVKFGIISKVIGIRENGCIKTEITCTNCIAVPILRILDLGKNSASSSR